MNWPVAQSGGEVGSCVAEGDLHVLVLASCSQEVVACSLWGTESQTGQGVQDAWGKTSFGWVRGKMCSAPAVRLEGTNL